MTHSLCSSRGPAATSSSSSQSPPTVIDTGPSSARPREYTDETGYRSAYDIGPQTKRVTAKSVPAGLAKSSRRGWLTFFGVK